MQHNLSADAVGELHAEGGCNCCGRKLNPNTMTWLELNFSTGRYTKKDGECPEAESQGWFAFGQACARKVLRAQQQSNP